MIKKKKKRKIYQKTLNIWKSLRKILQLPLWKQSLNLPNQKKLRACRSRSVILIFF